MPDETCQCDGENGYFACPVHRVRKERVVSKLSLSDRITLSMATFVAEYDKSSSDVAAYLKQRLQPLWLLVGEVASEKHDAYARVQDDTPRDHPDVKYADGYEAGVDAALKIIKATFDAIEGDSRKLAPPTPAVDEAAAF